MKLTRRGLLSALPVAATAAAQQPVAETRPSREQDLDNAREGIRNNLAALAKVKIPNAVEPAFQFKA